MNRIKLALHLAWCALFHDMRQRQGAWRCWTCSPTRPKKAHDPDLAQVTEFLRGPDADA